MIKAIQKYYLDTLPYDRDGRVVALGMFDGLHDGHLKIINEAVSIAKRNGLKTLVQTFNNLSKKDTGIVYTTDERISILESLGVDEVLVLNFSDVKDMSPEDYLMRIVKMSMNSLYVVCGFDYTFGREGKGDAKLLEAFCGDNMIEAIITPELQLDGRKISTAWLKEALSEGDIELAAKLCSGRNFFYSGKVCKGKQMGRQMGFPTANLNIPEDKFKVRRGVYVAKVLLGGKAYYGVANVGRRPTLEDATNDVIETYIFSFDEDIYGAFITTELLHFLRPESKFGSPDELAHAVELNKIEAKEYLKAQGLE
ncbi:MAG: riboflavin biosynthesis protein RibF [Saccharofermentans sp.]|nr:riboflavin biosynthesis protein RibF [Saccharofermentans sp.]